MRVSFNKCEGSSGAHGQGQNEKRALIRAWVAYVLRLCALLKTTEKYKQI